MKKIKRTFCWLCRVHCSSAESISACRANMNITEWMYQGSGTGSVGEFVQFTNTGSTPVDMTGWEFDDNHELGTTSAGPGAGPALARAAFGILQPGQSGILTEVTPATFDADWSLDPTVPVIGGNTQNLGRSDEINLYDNTGTLVDRLTYNDQGTGNVKGPRTNSIAAYIPVSDYGQNNASLAVAAVVGDGNGSRTSNLGEVGNPGPVATPEPASVGLLAAAGLFLGRRARSQQQKI